VPAPVHVFDAVVLAGGRGTRLGGADKPGLIVGVQTLLGSVVSAVTSAGADRIVVVGPERPAAFSPGPGDLSTGELGTGARGRVRYAREDPPGCGPVAALACGLGQVSAPALVLLAADLPFLRATHVTRLLTVLAGRDVPGVVLLDDSARPQWLVSCWPAALLHGALGRYTGTSLRGLLAPLDPLLLPDEKAPGEPPPWLDCDTEDDVRLAREWFARNQAARPNGSDQEAIR
jgi:molybdenum cofactor guanylyltransferase